MFNHGKCVVHGKGGLVEACYSSPDTAIECVVHGCDVLNKRGFTRPYVLSEHTLKDVGPWIIMQTTTIAALNTISLRYMKRRCYFLDNLSHYNYNYGRSAQWTGSKKEKKVHNTEHLGSTLMKAMLSEVSEFCNPRIKGTWSLRPHQQVFE